MATEAVIPSETKQKRKRTPSPRLIRAIDNMVANGGSKAQALRDAGFSEAIAHTPSKVTESQAFKDLADSLGLTDAFLTKALVADIKAKPKRRSRELELAFKVRGRLKEREDPQAGNIYNLNFFDADQLRKIASRTVDGDTTSPEESH